MADVLGPRPAAVCRELTKAFETIYRAPLPELAAEFAAMERVRGEIVVCVGVRPTKRRTRRPTSTPSCAGSSPR